MRPRIVSCIVIGAAAAWVLVAALKWGTLAATGADSYGYVSQAALWLRGSLVVHQPIALTVPWPNADWTFAPLGYRPGLEPGTIVPIYPTGLPLVMAVLQLVGGPDAVFLAVPLLGALLVIATAGLAWRLAGPPAGAIAAVVIASRSIVLSSAMWPMSDVPGAAWWALVLWVVPGAGLPSALGAGAAAAIAILTRPNLAGLAAAPALYLAARVWWGDPDRRTAVWRLVSFVALSAIGCLAVALIHTLLYGSPFTTGYGPIEQVYSLSHATTTASSYINPLRFEPAMVVLALVGAAGMLMAPSRAAARSIAMLCVIAVAVVSSSYLFYDGSPDWWYLRFLLPAFAPVAALAGAGLLVACRPLGAEWRAAALVLVSLLLVVVGLHDARQRQVFGLARLEARYATVARFVRDSLPPRAAFFAFQQSGSLRYYAGRMTLRFDLLQPEWFDTAITKMRARGYRPYFLVEEPELALFKTRFGNASVLGNLDWPPVAELRQPLRVWIFDPADRGKWRAGEPMFPARIHP